MREVQFHQEGRDQGEPEPHPRDPRKEEHHREPTSRFREGVHLGIAYRRERDDGHIERVEDMPPLDERVSDGPQGHEKRRQRHCDQETRYEHLHGRIEASWAYPGFIQLMGRPNIEKQAVTRIPDVRFP